jgi:DNA-directed RNA polymerase specialized sigma24 family protein
VNPPAWAEADGLLARIRPQLQAAARRLVRKDGQGRPVTPHDIEDLVQEGRLAVYDAWPVIAGAKNEAGMALTVARRRMADRVGAISWPVEVPRATLRDIGTGRASAYTTAAALWALGMGSLDAPSGPGRLGHAPDGDGYLLAGSVPTGEDADHPDVYAALKRIPERLAEVVRLTFGLDTGEARTAEEVAALVNRSVRTVGRDLAAGLAALRVALQEVWAMAALGEAPWEKKTWEEIWPQDGRIAESAPISR